MHGIDIAVVCHQGLGSSLWLKIQVEKIVTKYQIPAHVFQVDMDGLTGRNPHIAIGVNYLGNRLEEWSQTVIVVSNILDDELEEKLLANSVIKEIREQDDE